MNVADLLNPDKMKAVDERFRKPTSQDYENARNALIAKGANIPRGTPFLRSSASERGKMFRRSNFNKKH